LLPVTHPARLSTLSNLAGTCRAVGRDADALPMAKKVLESYLRVNDSDTGGATNNLASNYLKLGMLDDALDMAKQALQFFSRTLPENHSKIGMICHCNGQSRLCLLFSGKARGCSCFEGKCAGALATRAA
jgi:hypothetical protein